MKQGIYKITNPEGKVYIGKSTNIKKRWKQYQRGEILEQPKLLQSFLKFGWINHIFEIVEECTNLTEQEKYWITYFSSENEGLNGKIGRKSGFTFLYPEEAKKIKSQKMKQNWASGNFKRKWGKDILDTHTQTTYSNVKELLSANKQNLTNYSWFYRNLGDDKRFLYI
jgi:group I intron endonuclease